MRATQRSLNYLRKLGYICAVAEKWNPHVRIRQDLFGFIDVVGISLNAERTDGQIVAFQVVNTHLPEHIAKIEQSEAAQAWLAAGGAIVVHSWAKRGPRGKRKVWQCEEIEIAPRSGVQTLDSESK